MSPTLQQIIELLDRRSITYHLQNHAPTKTSVDSARERGEELSNGAKAIVYKIQDAFYLFVLAADQKLDPRKIKTYFKEKGLRAKKTRFATTRELEIMTGLVPGSIPPFGQPILPFDLYVDPTLLSNTRISFNAGSLEHSITMNLQDYLSVANPQIFSFSTPIED